MNRDQIEAGRTGGKFAEAFMLTGGIGAILFPFVFYYVSYTMVDKRDDFLKCIQQEEIAAASRGEEITDMVRTAIMYNMFMICLYLALHFTLFQRPEDYKTFKIVGYAYAIVVTVEIAVALILFIVIGVSECNTEAYGVAAILSSLAIVIVNGLTLALGIIYFLSKTRLPSAARIEAEPARRPEQPSQEQLTPKPQPVEKKEEEDVQGLPEAGGDDMDGIE